MISYKYYVIGTGGTGSYLVDHLGRMFGGYGEFSNSYKSIGLVDADTVSESNIMRQRFYRRDVGKQKTSVLESRLRMFSELSKVDCHNAYMTQTLMAKLLEQDSYPKCFISCVDNNTSRNRILAVLKPDMGTNQSPYKNWLYIDSGNTSYDGWTSMLLADSEGVITGIDMRNQDGAMRANENNDAPIVAGQGCGRRNAAYQTAAANQRNADLIAAQLTSHLKSGRSFGLIGWTVPDMQSDAWASTTYETAHLCPINT